jgi:hypothetical protein
MYCVQQPAGFCVAFSVPFSRWMLASWEEASWRWISCFWPSACWLSSAFPLLTCKALKQVSPSCSTSCSSAVEHSLASPATQRSAIKKIANDCRMFFGFAA